MTVSYTTGAESKSWCYGENEVTDDRIGKM